MAPPGRCGPSSSILLEAHSLLLSKDVQNFFISGIIWRPIKSGMVEFLPIQRAIAETLNSVHFLLTEVGHGLDARSIETVASLLPNGGFDLHTPNEHAAK